MHPSLLSHISPDPASAAQKEEKGQLSPAQKKKGKEKAHVMAYRENRVKITVIELRPTPPTCPPMP
jgi:hypothetical protein